MKQAVVAIILALLVACQGKSPKGNYCYTHTFKRVNHKHPTDTTKFYGFTDIDSALACARLEKKPLLLVFSGGRSMSIENLEWEILSQFGDNNFIQNNYVIAYLAIDNKQYLADITKVATIDNYTFPLRTVGNVYQVLQMKLASINTQPLFCFVDTNMTRYGQMMGYPHDKDELKKFILSGLKGTSN